MELVVLLLLLVKVTHQNESKVVFKSMSTAFDLADTFPALNDSRINILQQDKAKTNSFIVGVHSAILTVSIPADGAPTAELIIGDFEIEGYKEGEGAEARFNGIYGLAQTKGGYVISDFWNNCLRLVEPLTLSNGNIVWLSSTFAGRCTEIGLVDGPRLNARFRLPEGITELGNSLIIGDGYNNKIRKLDMDTNEVTTIHETERNLLSQIVIGKSEGEFYVTSETGILRTQNNKEAWIVGCAEPNYQQLKKAKFSAVGFSSVYGIAKLNEELLIATDLHTLRLVDLDLLVVDVICTGVRGDLDGDVKDCMLNYATSLALIDNVIYIGEKGAIRRLPYLFSNNYNSSTLDNSKQSLVMCGEPPTISNTRYTTLNSYTEGTEIYYQCIDSYMLVDKKNTKLTCTVNGSTSVWFGERIECQPKSLVAALVLAPITAIALVALIIVSIMLCRERAMRTVKKKPEDNNYQPQQPRPMRTTHSNPLPQQPIPADDEHYEPIDNDPYMEASTLDTVSYRGPSISYAASSTYDRYDNVCEERSPPSEC